MALNRGCAFAHVHSPGAEGAQRLGWLAAARFSLLEIDLRKSVLNPPPWESALRREVAARSDHDPPVAIRQGDENGGQHVAAGLCLNGDAAAREDSRPRFKCGSGH